MSTTGEIRATENGTPIGGWDGTGRCWGFHRLGIKMRLFAVLSACHPARQNTIAAVPRIAVATQSSPRTSGGDCTG